MKLQEITEKTRILALQKGCDLCKPVDTSYNKHYIYFDGIILQSLLEKWLRDNHKICILPYPIYEEGVFLHWALLMKDHETFSIHGKTFDIYEDAIECGLQECLKLI